MFHLISEIRIKCPLSCRVEPCISLNMYVCICGVVLYLSMLRHMRPFGLYRVEPSAHCSLDAHGLCKFDIELGEINAVLLSRNLGSRGASQYKDRLYQVW